MFVNKSVIGKLIGISLVFVLLLMGRSSETSLAAEPSNVYLPLVVKNYPKPLTIFGSEIYRNQLVDVVDLAQDANISWVRYNGIIWQEVEPTPTDNVAEYSWDKLSTFETEILALRDRGIEPMVIIRGTPDWARLPEYANYGCSRVADENLNDFAAFVADMVSKYSYAPYNIHYWEIGNEPDVHPEALLESPNAPYGCWGDLDDPYYGGGWYANMLKVVYPAIKQANPQAKVILGGLLLVCDPTVDPTYCKAAKYLEGILRNGGGENVDIIAYHAYPYWYQTTTVKDWDLTQIHWAHRGGTLIGKLSYIKEIMARYQVQKPIMMNEGGLVCGYSWAPNEGLCGTSEYEQAKSNFVVRMYARTGALNIMGSSWYTLNGPGWRTGGLLSGTTPLDSYIVYSFLTNKLGNAEYINTISTGDLEGYQYRNGDTHKIYQIYWSNSAANYQISKPTNTIAVYDRYGSNLSTGTQITVSFSQPVIIEIAP